MITLPRTPTAGGDFLGTIDACCYPPYNFLTFDYSLRHLYRTGAALLLQLIVPHCLTLPVDDVIHAVTLVALALVNDVTYGGVIVTVD